MAYVRITDTLIDGVRSKIRKMRDTTAEKQYPCGTIEEGTPLYDDVVEAVRTAAWREAPHLRTQMPESWCTRVTRFTARLHSGNELLFRHNIYDEQIVIPGPHGGYMPNIDVHPGDMSPALLALANAEATKKEERRKMTARFQEIEVKLVELLRSHKSLNTAVKEVPQLRMYVPVSYVERLEAPTAPRSRTSTPKQPETTPEKPEIDAGELAALGVAYRMANSSDAA